MIDHIARQQSHRRTVSLARNAHTSLEDASRPADAVEVKTCFFLVGIQRSDETSDRPWLLEPVKKLAADRPPVPARKGDGPALVKRYSAASTLPNGVAHEDRRGFCNLSQASHAPAPCRYAQHAGYA